MLQSVLSQQPSEFQNLIVSVLFQVLVPELSSEEESKHNSNFVNLMVEVVKYIANESWQNKWSSKLYLCWGLLVTCCSKITIDEKSLNWVDKRTSQIKSLQLDYVFMVYCNKNGFSNEKKIFTFGLPEEVKNHTSELVLK